MSRPTPTPRPVHAHLLAALGLTALALGACNTVVGRDVGRTLSPTPPDELDPWPDAAAGVTDTGLARLVTEAWEDWLAAHPFEASNLGDARYLGKIPTQNDVERQRRRDELQTLRARLAQIPTARLSEDDRLTAHLLDESMQDELASLGLGLEQWEVDPLYGPAVQVLDLCKHQPVETRVQRRKLVQRWRQIDTYMLRIDDDLRRGKRAGKVASRTAIEKVLRQLEAILDTSPLDSPLVAIATGGGRWVELPPGGSVSAIAARELGDARKQGLLRRANPHLQDGERLVSGTRVLIPADDDPLSPEERGAFFYDVLRAVEEQIYPAFTAYHDLLQQQLLPVARSDDHPGIGSVPGGAEAYPVLIHLHTSLPLAECDPTALHEYGLSEVARVRGEIADLGAKLFGTRDMEAIQKRLREDPSMFFSTREEILAKARETLDRAQARIPDFFGILPAAPCEVAEIPAYEAPNSTSAYYNAPEPDGSVPGRYYVNTYQPNTRPRYEAEVLAFHESIPGHHLQLAIQQELDDLPRFRRHQGCEAFVEGWALYSERLADEMGLYSSDLDRMGMLSFDAWRAARLVVDTGIHAMDWSRDRAIQYLYDNTLLSHENVENEVDRYIAWPGQALAYKVGQREIIALRDRARAAQGEAFSYPAFHDRILGRGALPLDALRASFDEWLGSPVPVEAGAR